MRREWRIDIGFQRIFLDQYPEHLARHRTTARGNEQRIINLPTQNHTARLFQIAFQPAACFFTERHQARFVAFAGDAQNAFIHADFHRFQEHQFGHAQTAGVHEFQHGAVTQSQRSVGIGCGQQVLNLCFR